MFGKRSKSKSHLNVSKESLDIGGSQNSVSVLSDTLSESREIESREADLMHSRHAGFSTHYLGSVAKFMMQPNSRKTSEVQLIEKIEQSQLDGRLLLRPTQTDAIRLRVDRHGFQVARQDSDDIVLRVPLHTLAQLIMYDDGFGKSNLAVKVIVGKDLFSCHVFQCPNEDSALSICETLQRVFRAIMSETDARL